MDDTKYRAWLEPRQQQANEIKAFRARVGGLVQTYLAKWVAARSEEDPLVGKPVFSLGGDAGDTIAPDLEPKITVTSSEGATLAFVFSAVLPQMQIDGPSLKLTTGEDLGACTVVDASPLVDDVNLRMHTATSEPGAEVFLSAVVSAFEDVVVRS